LRESPRRLSASMGSAYSERVAEFRMDEAERRAATIDSRGVLLLGVSVILTVNPDGLALVRWLTVGTSGFLFLSVLLAVVADGVATVQRQLRQSREISRPHALAKGWAGLRNYAASPLGSG
jgi:hypothetical protein